jgi:hypothetical protein
MMVTFTHNRRTEPPFASLEAGVRRSKMRLRGVVQTVIEDGADSHHHYTDSRHQYGRQQKQGDTRDARRADSKGRTLAILSLNSLRNDCCGYCDSQRCACDLSSDMTRTHTTQAGGDR